MNASGCYECKSHKSALIHVKWLESVWIGLHVSGVQSGAKIWILFITGNFCSNWQSKPTLHLLFWSVQPNWGRPIFQFTAPEATQDHSNIPPVCYAFMNMASTSAWKGMKKAKFLTAVHWITPWPLVTNTPNNQTKLPSGPWLMNTSIITVATQLPAWTVRLLLAWAAITCQTNVCSANKCHPGRTKLPPNSTSRAYIHHAQQLQQQQCSQKQ
jgi:hypothetical protein